jgi:hypothetical protein
MHDRQVILTHQDMGFTLPIHLKSGVAGMGTWQAETFLLTPFLQVADTPLVAQTMVESYLFTPECLHHEHSVMPEVTLVGRGVAEIRTRAGTIAAVPWELQLSYVYHRQNATLTALLRPQVHLDRATGNLCDLTPVYYGLQVTWESGWIQRGESWAASPAGKVIAIPRQTGVASIVTTTTCTLLADHTAPAAMLIAHETQPGWVATVGLRYSQLQVDYAASTRFAHSNSVPVITEWAAAEELCQVHTSSGWRQTTSFRRAPSQAPARKTEGDCRPGRYWSVIELSTAELPKPLVLVVPFRYWPEAATNPVQAQFAQLLLCVDLGDDYIVAYNFVSPHEFYQADDRDDILAEQAYIAHVLGNLFSDPDLCYLAVAMTDRLLKHQQPDGGFTFSISVNGERADYSDTNADVITCLLTLLNSAHLDEKRRHGYEQAMLRSAAFMLSFQDASGFFWGRIERPGDFKYPHQPWFTSYAAVSCLDIVRYLQCRDRWVCSSGSQVAWQVRYAGTAMTGPINDVIAEPAGMEVAPFLAAIEQGLRWLCSVQTETGAWRYDTTGSYADYDDLSNTSAAVWALSIAARMWHTHPEQQVWWQAATAGVRYLLTREIPAGSGQFFGAGIPHVQKLVYDYRLGFALQEYLFTAEKADVQGTMSISPTACACEDESSLHTAVRAVITRYMEHITHIQGLGILSGGWASLYSLEQQCYLHTYSWFERGSQWHKYIFLGWQGKLALLGLPGHPNVFQGIS